jgi:uncharacterized protein YndB with AHSA1/START domain
VTTPDLVQKYFFATRLATDWKVGSPITFRGEWEGKPYEDRGTVLSFKEPHELSFNYWSSFSGTEDRDESRQIIRYELAETEGGVCVTIYQSNTDTQERADHSAKNWKFVLDGLKSLVESGL